MPAPSPSTSPSRSAENGRQVSRATARNASQPLSTPQASGASVPPASMTSARPSRSWSTAEAMAWLDDEQAEVTPNTGPRRPCTMLTWPAGAPGMTRGTEKTSARVRSLDEQAAIVVLDRLGAEDADADDGADTSGSFGRRHDDAGLPQRFARRDHRDQAEAVHRDQASPVEADDPVAA